MSNSNDSLPTPLKANRRYEMRPFQSRVDGATDSDPTGGGALPNNMRLVSSQEIDGGEAGLDGNVSKVTKPVDGNPANDRVISFEYDFRNRRILTVVTDGITIWRITTAFDNQDQRIGSSTYVSSRLLILQSRTYFDVLGRRYRREIDGVNQGTGVVSGTLVAQNWYDLRRNVIKASKAGATFFTKTVYDALNRSTVTYTASVPRTPGVPAGDTNDVSADTVTEQRETLYDNASNVLLTTLRKRLHTATGVGPLQNLTTEPTARVSFVATWPDAIGRLRVKADYGTNGGTALARPDVAPAPSDTVLVTTNRFKSDGEANAIIDPKGLETRWDNDNAGRRICLTENYVAGSTVNTRVSRFEWHASGQVQKLTLQNAATGDQFTYWIFGTTLYDSEIADNDLIRAKIYAESDDWPEPLSAGPDGIYDREEYTYNRQGEAVTFKDADETVHAYAFDKLAREIADSVTRLGDGLDGAVLRIERAYELRGMLQTVTSFDAAAGGNIVNQVAIDFDDFGNTIDDHQSHDGAVVRDTTPKVGYGYTDGSNNTMRLTDLTYPNGRVLNTLYGGANSADDHLNRITGLNIGGETADLVDYTYCGNDWQVQLQYPQPGIELTYIKQGAEPIGDGGDLYTGYDRFGRTIDIRWQKISDGISLERIKYGFDRDSLRRWRQRVLATGLDNAYTYDGLNQVIGSAEGVLDLATGTINPISARTEAWNYDPTGNWGGYITTEAGATTLNQARVHDRGNRLMQIESALDPIILDRVDRMLEVPPGATGDWGQSLTLKWDAWSRMAQVSKDGAVLGAYKYDGLARRIIRSVSGIVWHTYYSDAWRPLEERQDALTSAAAQYFWGARHRDDLVRRDKATSPGGPLNETRYVLMDYFSPAAIVDPTGSVTERYAFSGFGLRSILAADFSPRASSECGWEFGFQGQLIDIETGLMNYGYRYYSPYLGRWTSKDPIGETGGINLYEMANNSPTNAVDLLGLRSIILNFSADSSVPGGIHSQVNNANQQVKGLQKVLDKCCKNWNICCDVTAQLSLNPKSPTAKPEYRSNADLIAVTGQTANAGGIVNMVYTMNFPGDKGGGSRTGLGAVIKAGAPSTVAAHELGPNIPVNKYRDRANFRMLLLVDKNTVIYFDCSIWTSISGSIRTGGWKNRRGISLIVPSNGTGRPRSRYSIHCVVHVYAIASANLHACDRDRGNWSYSPTDAAMVPASRIFAQYRISWKVDERVVKWI